jgi:hypothetical protein
MSAREIVGLHLRMGVPRGDTDRQFLGVAVNVRITTFTLLVSGAIAAAVLYLIFQRPRTPTTAVAMAPADEASTPSASITRLAAEANPRP